MVWRQQLYLVDRLSHEEGRGKERVERTSEDVTEQHGMSDFLLSHKLNQEPILREQPRIREILR
jgi:hypothetical protein